MVGIFLTLLAVILVILLAFCYSGLNPSSDDKTGVLWDKPRKRDNTDARNRAGLQ